MSDVYQQFREVNQFLPVFAFGWLMFRIVTSWPARWARPNHVLHYRAVLVTLAAFVLAAGLGAIVREHAHTTATIISPIHTALALVVLALCWYWPPREVRR